ncbi:MAG: hypothetical protein ACFFER_20140 [Candidatus Thorarchaeota archaeon]
MTLSTCLFPFMMLPVGGYGTPGVDFRGYSFISLLWGISLQTDAIMFYLFDIASLYIGLPQLIYAVCVYGVCAGKVSRKTAMVIGVIILISYAFLFGPRMFGWWEHDVAVYAGPLPITIIVGLLFTKYPGPPRLALFEGDEAEPSWWQKS